MSMCPEHDTAVMQDRIKVNTEEASLQFSFKPPFSLGTVLKESISSLYG